MIEPARSFLFQTAGAIQQMASAMEAAKVDACFVTDHPAPSAEWLHAHGHAAADLDRRRQW